MSSIPRVLEPRGLADPSAVRRVSHREGELLHDPSGRTCLLRLTGGWEARAFVSLTSIGASGPPNSWQTALASLQLWHPYKRISVLPPSRETHFWYEMFPLNSGRVAVRDFNELRELLSRSHGIEVPGRATLAALELWISRQTGSGLAGSTGSAVVAAPS